MSEKYGSSEQIPAEVKVLLGTAIVNFIGLNNLYDDRSTTVNRHVELAPSNERVADPLATRLFVKSEVPLRTIPAPDNTRLKISAFVPFSPIFKRPSGRPPGLVFDDENMRLLDIKSRLEYYNSPENANMAEEKNYKRNRGWAKTVKVNGMDIYISNTRDFHDAPHDPHDERGIYMSNSLNRFYNGRESYDPAPFSGPLTRSAEDFVQRFIDFGRVLTIVRGGLLAVLQNNSVLAEQTYTIKSLLNSTLGIKPKILKFQLPYQHPEDVINFEFVQRSLAITNNSEKVGNVENSVKKLPLLEPRVPKQPEFSSTHYISNIVSEVEPRFSLEGIGGHHSIKETIKEIALLFNHPEIAAEWNVAPPRGVLFYGEPGTGKTMLAHALAHETKSKLWEVDAAKIYDMWVGLSGKNISNLFDDIANYKGRLVVFLDEIDSVLTIQEKVGSGGADAERNQVTGIFKRRLNTITDEKPDVLIVAATNNLERLDPAIIRDGRFDYKIAVPMPDEWGRAQIITNHVVKFIESKVADQVVFDVPDLAKAMDGMSGAAIENIFNRLRKRKAVRVIQTGLKQTISQEDVLKEVTDYRTNG